MTASTHDPYASLRFPAFRFLVTARFLSTFAILMIETVLGWHLYEVTGSKFVLGLLGLLEIIPVLLFSLYAGQLADRVDRRRMTMVAQVGFLGTGFTLALLAAFHARVEWIYVAVLGIGLARAFNFPAASTLLVQTVPKDLYANGAAWSSNVWQVAAVLGPAFGGGLIALTGSAAVAYFVAAALLGGAVVSLSRMKLLPAAARPATAAKGSILEGFQYLFRTRLLLAIITLDLFAVLLGGAVALLPVYAKDILRVGPEGLGWLRAAPSIGAVLASMYIAHRRPFERAGRTLLVAVAGFGIATVVFGISTSPLLSFCMLFLTGVFDSFSVIIRSTLLLVSVPDEMRGRVSAINSIFISSSNELGAFESGVVAHAFGTVFSVVFGGCGTLVVVMATAYLVPELRKLGGLRAQEPVREGEAAERTGGGTA